MKKKNKIIVIVTLLNILQLLFIKPITPGFFALNFIWKTFYIIVLFGFPLLAVIPSAIFTIPLAFLLKGTNSFKTVWYRFTKNLFLTFAILILFLNSILLIGKYVSGNDAFPLSLYSNIEGFQGNTNDLKVGVFENDVVTILRTDSAQIETYRDGTSFTFKIEWISNSDYILIHRNEEDGISDTSYFRITNNTSDYFEGYSKIDKYADPFKLYKN